VFSAAALEYSQICTPLMYPCSSAVTGGVLPALLYALFLHVGQTLLEVLIVPNWMSQLNQSLLGNVREVVCV
jgi:hypothetical protein